ncbi:MAG TPA: hypothetical protein VG737_17930 [Cyclobacteriaceae bacterium]|nr:hypothetical protein [Cyclobacteriaceae bacterium]
MLKHLHIFLLFLSASALGQDSLAVEAIAAETSKNYKRINRHEWHLTRDIVTGESSSSGTQISFQYDKDVLIRIVCSGFNERGTWAKEFYPINGKLAFVYTTVEYFPDKAPPNTSLNWKKIPADEYRIYFQNGLFLAARPASWKGKPLQLQQEFERLLKRSK